MSDIWLQKPVLLVMGSVSDWPQMEHASKALQEFGVKYYVRVTSAHRTSARMEETMKVAVERGFKVVIAAAGGSAHLQGMSSGKTRLPVLAVAIRSSSGEYSTQAAIGSCIAMPKGVPLPFMGVGEAAAYNAGLLAVRILALGDPSLAEKYDAYVKKMAGDVPEVPDGLDPKDAYPLQWR